MFSMRGIFFIAYSLSPPNAGTEAAGTARFLRDDPKTYQRPYVSLTFFEMANFFY
jgi:hypothetical protein